MDDAAAEGQAAAVAALQLNELLEAPHSGIWKVAASCSFLGELRGGCTPCLDATMDAPAWQFVAACEPSPRRSASSHSAGYLG